MKLADYEMCKKAFQGRENLTSFPRHSSTVDSHRAGFQETWIEVDPSLLANLLMSSNDWHRASRDVFRLAPDIVLANMVVKEYRFSKDDEKGIENDPMGAFDNLGVMP